MRRLQQLLLLCLFPSVVAFADMIPEMPPMTCAVGSTESQSHEGTYCRPLTCKSDTECEKTQVCQAQGLCITNSTYYGRPDGRKLTREAAGETCSDTKSCAAGSCTIAKRCVPKGSPKAPEVTPPQKDPISPPVDPPDSKPTPDSEPVPDSQPTPNPTPNKIEPSRCSVEAASDSSGAVLFGLSLFGLVFVSRKRRVSRGNRS